MAGTPQDHACPRGAGLPRALKALRRRRGMSAAEAAAAMGMPLRSFEYFESGRGRLNLERVEQFARVLNADPYAIRMALEIGSPEFAVHCADNKLVTLLVMSLQDFDRLSGDLTALLDPATLMAAFSQLFEDLARQARERAAMARRWREDDRG